MGKFYSIDNKYIEYIQSKNVNIEVLLKKSNMSPKAIDKNGVSVTREQYINLMNTLDKMITSHNLLCYANVDSMIGFIPPLFAGLCAKDGITCFDRILKYKKIIGPFILDIKIDEEKLSIEFMFDDGDKELPKFSILSEQILMTSILRKGTGVEIVPRKVTSIYEYEDKAFEEYFKVEPYKDKEAVIEFNIEDVKRPFLTENNVMWGYLEPELQKRIKDMEVDESFAARVRTALFELIPSGEASIESVAKELNLSTRTLQRKLSEEKTTFLKQLNHTRELLSRSYLKDTQMTIDDIAYLIGYSDTNSFVRAFKTWTGMTIREYRNKK
ncbi:helix-turn-helix transcriptional regulator [uncultured Clostridium sp.]|uniref:helix-turn-helix domain-containing protein n=1 Tax=uncultured Clostridium sp. TaxID=59620 RepID=UPI00261CBB78|nr:helix-turn-helix transcriptional regulator [uncultured Clostridium sp.]